MAFETLKKRTDFLYVQGGQKWATPSLVLQARRRASKYSQCSNGKNGLGLDDRHDEPAPPRFGFTVTKRMGKAVTRNRIKRRLREAVRFVGPDYAKPGYDYVLIARHGALKRAFSEVLEDLQTAFRRVENKASKAR